MVRVFFPFSLPNKIYTVVDFVNTEFSSFHFQVFFVFLYRVNCVHSDTWSVNVQNKRFCFSTLSFCTLFVDSTTCCAERLQIAAHGSIHFSQHNPVVSVVGSEIHFYHQKL